MTSNLEGEARICSKCKSNPAREGQWTCEECHRVYMKDYVKTHKNSREKMTANQQFARGAEAMKKKLIGELTRGAHPGGLMSVYEFSNWLNRASVPQFEEAIDLKEPASGKDKSRAGH